MTTDEWIARDTRLDARCDRLVAVTRFEVRRSHVGLNPPSHRDDAKAALVIMGWKPNIATAAIERALTEVTDDSLETLIRTALRHCA